MEELRDLSDVVMRLKNGQVGIIPTAIGYLAIVSTISGAIRLYRAKKWSLEASGKDRKTLLVIQDSERIIASSSMTKNQTDALEMLLAKERIPFCAATRARVSRKPVRKIWTEFVSPGGFVGSVWNLGPLASRLTKEAIASEAELFCTTANVSRQPTLLRARSKTHYPHKRSSLSKTFISNMDFIVVGKSAMNSRNDGKTATFVDFVNEPVSVYIAELHSRRISSLLRQYV